MENVDGLHTGVAWKKCETLQDLQKLGLAAPARGESDFQTNGHENTMSTMAKGDDAGTKSSDSFKCVKLGLAAPARR